jgi:hypothetical protein
MHSKSKKHQIHLSCWMEVRSRFSGWMRWKIQELSNTSLMCYGSPMSLQWCGCIQNQRNVTYIFHFGWTSKAASKVECIRKSKKCHIDISFVMEARCRFNNWVHSKIKGMSNTYFILDGSPKSLERFDAFKNKRHVNYIYNCGWKSDVASTVGCIRKSQCQIHLSFWREVRRRCNAWIYRIRNESDADPAADFDELEMSGRRGRTLREPCRPRPATRWLIRERRVAKNV